MLFYKLIMKILLGGGDNMVDLYVALIINNRRSFDKVPLSLRAAVKADLEALGLDENGKPKTE